MKLEQWFSTPIWHEDLNLDNDKLLEFCIAEKSKDPLGAVISNRGGWQSKDIDLSTIVEFKECMIDRSLACIKDMGYHKPNSLYIHNAWININQKGHLNEIHIHSKSDFSGVYYVNSNEDCGDIKFYRNFSDAHLLYKHNIDVFKAINCAEVNYKPVKGRLLMFPSYLPHSVDSNQTHIDRVSVAFNIKIEY